MRSTLTGSSASASHADNEAKAGRITAFAGKMTHETRKPLSGITVLDLGQYVSGPIAATLLADAGARVIRIEKPDGPSLDDPGNAFLLRGRTETHRLDLKSETGLRAALALVASADVLIENFMPGALAALGLGAEACLARNPALIYCSLPAFPEEDERANVAGWEGVVLAEGGAFVRPCEGSELRAARAAGSPENYPLFLASCFGGCEAALAVAAALIARVRDGGLGQRVEVPLTDALLEAAYGAAVKVEVRQPSSPFWVCVPGLYRCRDNRIINLSTTVFRHIVALARAVGREDLIEGGLINFATLRDDPEQATRLKAELVALFATRDATEWEELLGAAGVPVAMFRSTREWLLDDGAKASGCVVEVEDERHGKVRTLGAVVEFEARGQGRRRPLPLADAGAPPLVGFRVLDLARVAAAPALARILADLGAEVIKIDSDPAQRQTSVHEPLGHIYLNRGKRSAMLDLKEAGSRSVFRRLARDADVLVTNVSFSRLEPLGLGEAQLADLSPDMVVSYVNMHGTTGPRADWRGYAGIADTITGLASLTGNWDAVPSGGLAPFMPSWAHTDFCAGVLGAFATVAALFDRIRTGRRWGVLTSLTRVALLEQMPFAVLAEGIDPARGRGFAGPTHHLYTAADAPVFVALHGDDVAEARRRLGVGADEPLGRALERAIAAMPAGDCAALLRFGKSAAAVARSADYTVAPDGAWARRGMVLSRRSDDYGTVVSHAPVVRLVRTPLRAGPAPRPFGVERCTEWAMESAMPKITPHGGESAPGSQGGEMMR
jgi:crotonobetainyl-CoA:carnitine CoA-transferase CaiB-like acyl-CoA transferase